jgi:hypothetical protein
MRAWSDPLAQRKSWAALCGVHSDDGPAGGGGCEEWEAPKQVWHGIWATHHDSPGGTPNQAARDFFALDKLMWVTNWSGQLLW